MERDKQIEELLNNSNYSKIGDGMSDFIKAYIRLLLRNLLTYVDDGITVGKIELVNEYYCNRELSQVINGVPSAFSAIDAEESVLVSFADKYSRLGIKEYDILAKDSLLDFLNLHNGLFAVQLSKLNICELSLGVPKQNGSFIMNSPATGDITVIPIRFPFGTIKFLLCELN